MEARTRGGEEEELSCCSVGVRHICSFSRFIQVQAIHDVPTRFPVSLRETRRCVRTATQKKKKLRKK